MNEEEIDLREILAILRKRWWLILIITAAAIVVGGISSFYIIKPTYQASTSLIVSKSQTAQYNNGQIQFQDVQTNRLLASTYAEIATSRSVLQEAINKLNLNMTTDQLKKNIDVIEEGDTEVINISAKDSDPKIAADIANAVAGSFIDNIVKIMKIDNVSVIDEAVPPTTKISPKPILNMSIAAILGIMVSMFVIFLLEYFDKTYKDVDDVKKYLDLPVLGVIPELKD